MVKTNRGNWKEIFEDAKKNTVKTLTFPGKPYSIAIFPQVYGDVVTEDQFYQELANIIIKEAHMESKFTEVNQHERTTRKQIKEEKRSNREL
ncbi:MULTISPECIES: hypothetical protein [Bacillus]|uniref:hypothetical protein n=1 Tax=Bacillus TaxID=1386 RepID=UPI0005D32543|nr:hypothetical protein [Bacillus altitudinis]KQL39145.1 hypothetical protein AN962_16640 [Bacillus sp. FJAT-21955]KJF45937.1 hypothetical protein BAIE_18230 [Bacillus altitudinis]MBU8654461.1 hypothetical protein [Bacillus altitudinis]MBU8779930.1 hypothetical protein [Bacillus altitudinis]NMF14987.1 hypothetical protein [Bacillus altitudinis]